MKNLTLILAFLFFPLITFSQNKKNDPLETDFERYVSNGDSLSNLKQFDASIEYYTKALEFNIDNPKIHFKRGMAFFAQKQYAKAISDYTKVIDADVDYKKDAYFSRGMSKLSSDNMRMEGCEDLAEAKRLGFKADWEGLSLVCPSL